MTGRSDYYVYVYIDPRNYEEFYYGKGTGSRKNSHLKQQGESFKTKRINEIRLEGLEPIVRVIAKGLTEPQALLVEKTLLWKLGKQLTNVSGGGFSEHFRPHDYLHRLLPGFDYNHGFYYYNVGEGEHRCWEDYTRYNFISAGQGKRWRDAIGGFNEGDLFAAYLKGCGYVGIGQIHAKAQMINKVLLNNKPMLTHSLQRNMAKNCDNAEKSEYVCLVDWIAHVPRGQAKWKAKSNLYTTPLVRASLDAQPDTIHFLEKEFNFSIEQLMM